jgi:hypothetical protein
MTNIKGITTAVLITSTLFLSGCGVFSKATPSVVTASLPLAAMVAAQTPAGSILTSPTSTAILKEISKLCLDATGAKVVADNVFHGGAAKTVLTASILVNSACHTEEAITAISKDPTTSNWLIGLKNVLESSVEVAAIVSAAK